MVDGQAKIINKVITKRFLIFPQKTEIVETLDITKTKIPIIFFLEKPNGFEKKSGVQ